MLPHADMEEASDCWDIQANLSLGTRQKVLFSHGVAHNRIAPGKHRLLAIQK